MCYLEEKQFVNELYDIILCHRNLHYVFEIPAANNLRLTPNKYKCSMEIGEMPSDKNDAIAEFVTKLETFASHINGVANIQKTKQQEVLFDFVGGEIGRMIEHYKGLISGEDC